MILVLGATGRVGRRLVGELAAAGAPVRAGCRTAAAAGLPDGVEPVEIDLAEPASLERHLAGIRACFLLWPFTAPGRAETAGRRVVRAIAAATPRVVHLSAAAAATAPRSAWAIVEREVERAAREWTILRPTGFAANTSMWADQITAGSTVRWPFGAARRSLIHEADIAEVAARALLEPGHAGARHLLTGPSAPSQIEQVRTISEVIGRPLRWSEMPSAEAEETLAEIFGDRAFARQALEEWAGFVERPERVSDTVPRLLGRPARSYADWVTDNAATFGGVTPAAAT